MNLSRTNLARLILSHFLIRLRDCGNTVFREPCNNILHGMLINKLVKYRLVGMTNKWIHCWLENLIRFSSLLVVSPGKKYLLWHKDPPLFRVIINDIDGEVERLLIRSADDTALCQIVNIPDNRNKVWNDKVGEMGCN